MAHIFRRAAEEHGTEYLIRYGMNLDMTEVKPTIAKALIFAAGTNEDVTMSIGTAEAASRLAEAVMSATAATPRSERV
jgi:hypothetical protein